MAKAGPKRKQNGYKLPESFPKGEILEDVQKKSWRLGSSIGSGGFGLIYAAQNAENKSNAYPYAVKIEPHGNGPLYVEMQFYMRNAKEADVEKFMSSKKLTALGMPIFIASGSHVYKDEKYRFLTMPKFGSDIWKLYLENKRQFSAVSVYKLSMQVLHVLEYIHSMGYTHGDIKGANLLLGNSPKDKNQVYLVDFGLACKYTKDKPFKVDPKRAHNGTIEYTSRDAHDGVPTRRGDLEILFYNMIHWFGATLPWEKLKGVKVVQESKVANMDNIEKFLKACFPNSVPGGLLELGKYIQGMQFNADPEYTKLEKVLLKGLKDSGGTISEPLTLKEAKKRSSTSGSSPNKKLKSSNNTEEEPKPKPRTRKAAAENGTAKTNAIPAKKPEDEEDEENDEEVADLDLPPRGKRAPRSKANNIGDYAKFNNNGEVLTSEMIRIKGKMAANKPAVTGKKRPAKQVSESNVLVPVPSTSRAKPSAGLKKKHIADALPHPKTRIVLEVKDNESDDDVVAPNITKRKNRRK